MRRMQTRTGVSVEQLLDWKTFGSEISVLKKLIQLPCFFFALFICPSGWFVGKVHWVHDLPSSRMFLITGIMMCGYLSWNQSKVPWIPPNFDVHIPPVLWLQLRGWQYPSARVFILDHRASSIFFSFVAFRWAWIWQAWICDWKSHQTYHEVYLQVPYVRKCGMLSESCSGGTPFGVCQGSSLGHHLLKKKRWKHVIQKSRWAWSPGWKVKILASGAWLVTVICPKSFGKSLDPWCLQTCKCKCPPRKPLQSRHCDRKDHERRWLQKLLTSLCDGQFCISFWYSLCKPGHEKNPGKHLPNQSPVIPWWSWTLVVGITTFGTSFQTTNHQVVLEPGKRIFHPVLRILSSPFSALESLRIGVVGGVGWGCQQRCYGFLPR